jgi:hypothetical protein
MENASLIAAPGDFAINLDHNPCDDGLVRKSVLECKVEGFAVEFFNGPWLPKSHQNEFVSFYSKLNRPVDVLDDLAGCKHVFNVLLAINEGPQLSLFHREDVYKGLESLADQLHKKKPLYQRWDQKVNGKDRTICVPNKNFRLFIESYVLPFVKSAKVHPKAHGAEPGWSPKKSIESHLPIGSVLSFDMQSAFEQVELCYVFDFYYDALKGFADGMERVNGAGFLSMLSTVKYGGCVGLPIGSPLSTPLFNRLLYPVDQFFDKVSKKKGLDYSRWVDDFMVTSPKRKNPEYLAWALSVMREDFQIAPLKVFYQANPCYILGYEVDAGGVTKVDPAHIKEVLKGKQLDPSSYSTERERECSWFTDYAEE